MPQEGRGKVYLSQQRAASGKLEYRETIEKTTVLVWHFQWYLSEYLVAAKFSRRQEIQLLFLTAHSLLITVFLNALKPSK